MTKRVFTTFIFFASILICGCGGVDCTYSLHRRQLKEHIKSSNCIKTYDTVDNRVHIEVIDTLTGELLDRKIKSLK